MALWQSIEFDNGTSNFTYEDVEGFAVNEEGNRVELASGISKRRDVAYGLEGTIWEAAAFTEILPFMEANDDLTVTVTLDDGGTRVFSVCRALFTPAMSPVGDLSKVWIDAANVGDLPSSDADMSWADLGTAVGESQPELEARAVDLNEGNRTHYSDAYLTQTIELLGDQTAAITEGRHDIAIEHPDGGERAYRNVWVDKPIFIPRPQTQAVDVTVLMIAAAAGTFADIIEFPAAPEDLFYGVQFQVNNYGYATGNVITTT